GIGVRVLHAAGDCHEEYVLRDAHRASLEAHDVTRLGELRLHLVELHEDVLVLGAVRILRGAVLVLAAYLYELAADVALVARAIPDEDDLLPRLRIYGTFVGSEHDVHAGHGLVALRVEEPEDLDGLLDGARAAAPAVVRVLVFRRGARVG